MDEYYKLLGVSSSALPEQIRLAYVKLVKQWHPDQFAGNPTRWELAQEMMKRINAAYDALCAQNSVPRKLDTEPDFLLRIDRFVYKDFLLEENDGATRWPCTELSGQRATVETFEMLKRFASERRNVCLEISPASERSAKIKNSVIDFQRRLVVVYLDGSASLKTLVFPLAVIFIRDVRKSDLRSRAQKVSESLQAAGWNREEHSESYFEAELELSHHASEDFIRRLFNPRSGGFLNFLSDVRAARGSSIEKASQWLGGCLLLDAPTSEWLRT